MNFKRRIAVLLSCAMVMTSTSLAPVSVYGAEDVLLMEDTLISQDYEAEVYSDIGTGALSDIVDDVTYESDVDFDDEIMSDTLIDNSSIESTGEASEELSPEEANTDDINITSDRDETSDDVTKTVNLSDFVDYITAGYTLEFKANGPDGANNMNWSVAEGGDYVDSIDQRYNNSTQTVKVTFKQIVSGNNTATVKLKCLSENSTVNYKIRRSTVSTDVIDDLAITVYSRPEVVYDPSDRSIKYTGPEKGNSGIESVSINCLKIIENADGAYIQVFRDAEMIGSFIEIMGNEFIVPGKSVETMVLNLGNNNRFNGNKDHIRIRFNMAGVDSEGHAEKWNNNIYDETDNIPVYRVVVNVVSNNSVSGSGETAKQYVYYGLEGQRIDISGLGLFSSVSNGESEVADAGEIIVSSDISKNTYTAVEDNDVDSVEKIKEGEYIGKYRGNNGLVYSVDKIYATVFAYEGENVEKVKIPGKINIGVQDEKYDNGDRTVRVIGKEAFKGNVSIKEVVMPATIAEIQDNAFEGCASISAVSMPVSVTTIGNSVFAGCTTLSEAKLPRRLKKLGGTVFSGCDKLEELHIPNSLNESATVASGALAGASNLTRFTFAEDTKKLAKNLFSQCTSLKNIVLPDSLTDILDSVFEGCTNLEYVKMPEDMTYIGKNAFKGCSGLKNVRSNPENTSDTENIVEVPRYMVTLDDSAFHSCTSIERVTIPRTIKDVGASAFSGCIKMEKMSFVAGDENKISEINGKIGNNAFNGCIKLDGVVIPQTVVSIGASAFANCSALASAEFVSDEVNRMIGTIGDSAFANSGLEEIKFESKYYNIIGNSAFANCKKLVSANFIAGTEITAIRNNAFAGCEKLERVDLPDSLQSLGIRVFYNCINLGKKDRDGEAITLVVPDKVNNIGYHCFENCAAITDIHLSKGLKEIGDGAFKNCGELEQIMLPKSIDNVYCEYNVKRSLDGIGAREGLFVGCDKLRNINFESGITSIASYLLYNTDSIYKINVPMTVAGIGVSAFEKCDSLRDLIYEGDPELSRIGDKAFLGCKSLENYRNEDGSIHKVISDSVTEIGAEAFSECDSLKEIQIPKKVGTLGSSAFKNCDILENAYIPDSVKSDGIGASCFEGCEKLVTVRLPRGIEVIPGTAFKGCIALSLSDNDLPKTLKSIKANAFENCDAITTLDFSKHPALSVIEKEAFKDCDGLTTLIFSPATSSIGEGAFDDCNKLNKVELGTGLSTIPGEAFANLGNLPKIVIPRNVRTIKTKAFWNDKSLSEAHISKETEIENEAFSFLDNLTIYGEKDSPAHEYAKQHGEITFIEERVPITELKFAEESIIMKTGSSLKVYDDIKVNIKPVNYSDDIIYSSSKESILKVTKTINADKSVDVKAEALKRGTADLLASVSANSVSASVVSPAILRVEVKDAIRDIKLDMTDETLYPGEELTLFATPVPQDAYDTSLSWTSSNPDVATVDSTGRVKAIKEATQPVIITVMSNDVKNVTKTCTVRVIKRPEFKKTPVALSGNKLEVPISNIGSGKVKKGTKIMLSCSMPGANIYYSVDGADPGADYEGTLLRNTKLYTKPVEIDRDKTIKAFALLTGFKDSPVATFTYTVDTKGDIDDGDLDKLGDDPEGLWFAFDGDDVAYPFSSSETETAISVPYTGVKQNFDSEIHVYDGMTKLAENVDYKVSYKNSVIPADPDSNKKPTFMIKGMGNYKFTSKFTYTIEETDSTLEKAKGVKIDGLIKKLEYTGSPITRDDLGLDKVVVKQNGNKLTENVKYEVSYPEDKSSGSFGLTFYILDGNGVKSGYIEKNITVKPFDFKKNNKGRLSVSLNSTNASYSPTGATPEVTVKFNNELLKEGIDYTLSFKKNKKLGKAKAVVKGKGLYKGKYEKEFDVVQKEVSDEALDLFIKDVVETSDMAKILKTPVITDGGTSIKSKYFKLGTCTYYDVVSGNEIKATDKAPVAGTLIKISCTVTATDVSGNPYKGNDEITGYYRVIKAGKDIKSATVNPNKLPFAGGDEIIPISTSDFNVTMPGNVTLKAEEYEIESITNNRFIGTCTVVLRGKGEYGGTKKCKFKIVKKTY